jgi:acetyltransferase-like isoleucine patch superfamily enzyme
MKNDSVRTHEEVDHLRFEYERRAKEFQPWLASDDPDNAEQTAVHALLAHKAGAILASNSYVARDANIYTHSFELGEGSWVAAGAIIRGNVSIGRNSSVNPYAHIAGNVSIGSEVRIAGNAAIYGFNHGSERTDISMWKQGHTSKGVRIEDDVWIGTGAIVLDGCHIASHCIVGAGAVVTKSFPEYQIILGNPARSVGDRRTSPVALPTPDTSTSVSGAVEPAVRKLLYDNDPYSDFKDLLPLDLQGWGSNHPIFERVLREVKPKLVVEVGSWKGASAIHLADSCRSQQLSVEIVCVDTWLGNWQHWTRSTGHGSRSDLRVKNGFPQLYYQFLSNVVRKGFTDVVTPLPLTSAGAAKLFKHHNIKPDLIYLDGDHEYEAAQLDLQLWMPLVSDIGLIMGDDYDWPGVKRAVDDLAGGTNLQLEIDGNKFILRR